MSKRGCLMLLLIALAIAVLPIIFGCFFAVHQTEQVIITQFGKPVGDPITDPGLHLKLPMIQDVNRIDKRFLEWDGTPVPSPRGTRLTSTSIPLPAGESTMRRPFSFGCAMNEARNRVWRTFLEAKRATLSPSMI